MPPPQSPSSLQELQTRRVPATSRPQRPAPQPQSSWSQQSPGVQTPLQHLLPAGHARPGSLSSQAPQELPVQTNEVDEPFVAQSLVLQQVPGRQLFLPSAPQQTWPRGQVPVMSLGFAGSVWHEPQPPLMHCWPAAQSESAQQVAPLTQLPLQQRPLPPHCKLLVQGWQVPADPQMYPGYFAWQSWSLQQVAVVHLPPQQRPPGHWESCAHATQVRLSREQTWPFEQSEFEQHAVKAMHAPPQQRLPLPHWMS